MEFDKNKVYTAANADSLRTGSMGYYADNLEALKRRVSSEVNEEYGMLTEILDEGCSYRFRINDIMDNALFYLVEEPQKKKFRPYNNTKEMDEMKSRISMALKDPVLQQGFEIICKENVELKKQDEQLTKAKEIIKRFSEFVNDEVELDPEHPQEYTDLWIELCEKAEQFLNSEVKSGRNVLPSNDRICRDNKN